MSKSNVRSVQHYHLHWRTPATEEQHTKCPRLPYTLRNSSLPSACNSACKFWIRGNSRDMIRFLTGESKHMWHFHTRWVSFILPTKVEKVQRGGRVVRVQGGGLWWLETKNNKQQLMESGGDHMCRVGWTMKNNTQTERWKTDAKPKTETTNLALKFLTAQKQN